MTVAEPFAGTSTPLSAGRTGPRAPWWLLLSLPLALLGAASSITGLAVDRVYARETESWQAQAIGQDVANLVVLPTMLVLAYAAARGSARALLAWAGTVVYSAYAFAIYAFAVHFGPLFLVHVAVLGLSTWALIGFLGAIDPVRVRAAYRTDRLAGFASVLLIVLASAFAVMWVAQDLPAMVDGRPPTELEDTGLLTNPVHVLDLSLFLPLALVAGVALRRRRPIGFVLAPVALTAMAGIGLGIVALTAVASARELDASFVVAGVIATLAVVQALTCGRLLAAVDPGARVLHGGEPPQ
jgi:hypothetical protein